MALSPEHKEQLLHKVRAKEPIWHISGWLRQECGLTFKEATLARKEAEEELGRVVTAAPAPAPLPTKEEVPWTEESLIAEAQAQAFKPDERQPN